MFKSPPFPTPFSVSLWTGVYYWTIVDSVLSVLNYVTTYLPPVTDGNQSLPFSSVGMPPDRSTWTIFRNILPCLWLECQTSLFDGPAAARVMSARIIDGENHVWLSLVWGFPESEPFSEVCISPAPVLQLQGWLRLEKDPDHRPCFTASKNPPKKRKKKKTSRIAWSTDTGFSSN